MNRTTPAPAGTRTSSDNRRTADRQRESCADPELGAFEADIEHVEHSAQERQRGRVVARHEGCDLGDPRGASVRDQLRRESGADPAVLELVGDLERDLGARAVADEARDGRRPRVTLRVGDEHVMVRVGSGQLFEVGAAEARLRAVEAGAARPLAEALEHGADRSRVAAAERPHDKRRASLRFDDPGVHVLRVSRPAVLSTACRALEVGSGRRAGVFGCG